MPANCTTPQCELDTYENEDKCIVHCEKHQYSEDFHKVGFLNAFYNQLIENVLEQSFNEGTEGSMHLRTIRADFKNQLMSNTITDEFLHRINKKKQVFVFNKILFT